MPDKDQKHGERQEERQPVGIDLLKGLDKDSSHDYSLPFAIINGLIIAGQLNLEDAKKLMEEFAIQNGNSYIRPREHHVKKNNPHVQSAITFRQTIGQVKFEAQESLGKSVDVKFFSSRDHHATYDNVLSELINDNVVVITNETDALTIIDSAPDPKSEHTIRFNAIDPHKPKYIKSISRSNLYAFVLHDWLVIPKTADALHVLTPFETQQDRFGESVTTDSK